MPFISMTMSTAYSSCLIENDVKVAALIIINYRLARLRQPVFVRRAKEVVQVHQRISNIFSFVSMLMSTVYFSCFDGE